MDLTIFRHQYESKSGDVSFNVTISVAGNPLKGNLQWYVTLGGDQGLSSGEGMILGPGLLMTALEPYDLNALQTSELLYFFGQMVATCDQQDWGDIFDIMQVSGEAPAPFNEAGEYIAEWSPQSIDEL